ncbi:hypothetical protein MAQ58_20495 [Enterobacter sp. DRP3]|nr:hypothetical protein [Enterobacter sp. DRP3]
MRNSKLSIICITIFIISILAFLFQKIDIEKKTNDISCRGGYDVYYRESLLRSTIIISMANKKGTISLLGDYYANGVRKNSVRIFTNFESQRAGNTYSMNTINAILTPKTLINDADFMNMINTSIFQKDVLAVYDIKKQNNGNYIFLYAGSPIFTCVASN